MKKKFNVHDCRRMLAAFAMLCVLALSAVAQGWTTSGVVVDETGEPLIGATVMEQGTTQGTATNYDGEFTLNVKPGAKIVISYVGYEPQTIAAVNGKVNVTLKPNTQVLDDVVVIGYGVQRKSDVTGAIASVKASDIENRTITNPQAALSGKTSGVQVVTASGAPGSAPQIRVRGYSSNSSMDPLYVVDGVRLSDISGIDPADIESMEVLKDAASAAIYGAQAGNGVVLITTKSGSKGNNGWGTIRYDFQWANQTFGRRPKMLDSNQYIEFMEESGLFTQQDILNLGWNGITDTNWYDVAFEHGNMFKHNVTFEGANDKGSLYASVGYLTNNGPVAGDQDYYQRLTANINADYQIKPWLKIGTTQILERYNTRSVSSNDGVSSLMASVYCLDPLTPNLYEEKDLTAKMLQNKDLLLKNPEGYYYGVSNYYDAENVHPLIQRDNTKRKSEGYNVTGSAYLNFNPWKPLTFTSRFGYRLWSGHEREMQLPYYGSGSRSNGTLRVNANNAQTIYYQWENFFNYAQTFNKVHNVTAMAGMSFSKSKYSITSGGGASAATEDADGNVVNVDVIPAPDFDNWAYLNFVNPNANLSVGGIESEEAQYSWFGRVGYNYDNKYMIQASLRADAYDLSKLSKKNRWGYFPAVSAGWVISQEDFMGWSRPAMDYLKIRGSWGKNGSVAPLSNYSYSTNIARHLDPKGYNAQEMRYSWNTQFGSQFPTLPDNPFTGQYQYTMTYMPSTMGNDGLGWEKMAQWDLGFDARFFNSRLTFTFDYYQKKTEGLLLYGVIPSLSLGGTTSPMNAGTVKNSGFEFDLGWQDRIGDFSYSVNANLSTLHNKVEKLHPSVPRIDGVGYSGQTLTLFEEGEKVWHFYGYKYLGVNQETGEAMFDDMVDGIPGLTPEDKTNIGDAIPDVTYGITVNLAYKGFDFTFFGSGTAGNDVFMAIQRPDKGTSNRMKEVFYDGRWVAGVNSPSNPAKLPSATTDYTTYLYSSGMVFSGDFFKIRQLQLGYTIPKNLTRKIFVENFRAYVSLDDFFTFSSYPGMDPEVAANYGSGQGIDFGTYPTSKKVVLGFNITF